MRKPSSVPLFVLTCLLAVPGSAPAMGFYSSTPPTFREEASWCRLIVYGRLQPSRNSVGEEEGLELVISDVVKPHPSLKGITMLFLQNRPCAQIDRYLFFCFVDKGRIEPGRGEKVSAAVVPYLRGLLTLDCKDRVRVLRYCFDYLEHPDEEIARDAYKEYRTSSDADILRAAAGMSPSRLRAWLQSPATSPDRLRLYGLLLGCCGKDRDAEVLRALLDRLIPGKDCSWIDGILTGYILLRPKEGRAYARRLLKDAGKPFAARYAALLMARFFRTNLSDRLAEDELLDLLRPTLQQNDINDLTVESLRKWHIWKMCDEVLALEHKSTLMTPLTRRALVRYALECPGSRAAAFVAAARQQDAEGVEDIEENLALERVAAQPSHKKRGRCLLRCWPSSRRKF